MSDSWVAGLVLIGVVVLIIIVATIREIQNDGYGRRPFDRDYDSRWPKE